MANFDFKTATPDTSFPVGSFLFGADSQAAATPSIYAQSTVWDYWKTLSNTWSANGAVSAPASTGTGTWYSGGSATTTKPYWLIEPTGTTSTGWSTSGTGLGVNAASGFTGNLIDLQTNGTSRFKVAGSGIIEGSIAALFGGVGLGYGVSGELLISSSGAISIGSSGLNSPDTYLRRDAANTLALRNSTTAQQFNVYKTWTDASNYSRFQVDWQAGAWLTIGPIAAGTGTAYDMYLDVPSGKSIFLSHGNANTPRWQMNASGHFLAGTDNSYDIGASGATRPRTIYAATSILNTGTAGGIGYGTGSGGTVSQSTNKSTGVTLNKSNGTITMDAASLASLASVSFTLTNSLIAATDVVIVSIKSGATANSYVVGVVATAAGSCVVQIYNSTLGALAEAVVLSFAVIKAVAA